MPCALARRAATGGDQGPELADIVRVHGGDIRLAKALAPVQHRALRAIESCRTAALGGHRETCDRCGISRAVYHSCRNRHCPKCQTLAKERWLEARRTEVQHAIERGEGELAAFAREVAARVAEANLATMARAGVAYDLLTWESDILALGFWEHAFERLRDAGAIRLEADGPNAGCWVLPFGAGSVEMGERTVSEDKVLVTSRGIATYDYMRTNDPDIYAVGDAAEYTFGSNDRNDSFPNPAATKINIRPSFAETSRSSFRPEAICGFLPTVTLIMESTVVQRPSISSRHTDGRQLTIAATVASRITVAVFLVGTVDLVVAVVVDFVITDFRPGPALADRCIGALVIVAV